MIFISQFLILNLSLQINHILFLLQWFDLFIQLIISHLSNLANCKLVLFAKSSSHLSLLVMDQSVCNILLALSLFKHFILKNHILHHCICFLSFILEPFLLSFVLFKTHCILQIMYMLRPMHFQLCLCYLFGLAKPIKYFFVSLSYLPVVLCYLKISFVCIHVPPLLFLGYLDVFANHVPHFSITIILHLFNLGIFD